MTCARIDRLDRQFRRVVLRQQRDEFSTRDLFSEHERRPIDDAGSGERRCKQHLGIVGCHPAWTTDNVRTKFRVDQRPVSNGDGFAKREPRCLPQVVRAARRSVTLEVVRGRTDDHSTRCEPACDQA